MVFLQREINNDERPPAVEQRRAAMLRYIYPDLALNMWLDANAVLATLKLHKYRHHG